MEAEAARQGRGYLGQAAPLTQQLAAIDVGGEVEVADQEPVGRAVALQQVERAGGVARDAPAKGRVRHARQRVEHRIEIGADPEPEMLEIVGGIADHRQRMGRQFQVDPLRELGPPNATGESDDCGLRRHAIRILSTLTSTHPATSSA